MYRCDFLIHGRTKDKKGYRSKRILGQRITDRNSDCGRQVDEDENKLLEKVTM